MPRILILLAVAALTLVGAAPGRSAEVGLSDQTAATWSDARVRALGVHYARLIVPYDAATNPVEVARTQAWLEAVSAAGLAPHVAFEHLRGDACPQAPCTTPTRVQYRAAVQAFRARWPQVTTFTTWNEANHASQPVAGDPEAVAGYWAELTAACPSCTVVAGDVLDSGGYVRWLQRFLAAAPREPQLWGLHNYGDVTYGTTTGTDAVLAAVPGKVWIEETGGIVTLRSAAGRITLSTNEARAGASVTRAFAIAAARPRLERLYLYHWRAASLLDRFDAGLVRPDGSERASLAAARAGIAAARAASTAAATTTAAATRPTVTARWTKGRARRLLVRVTCTASDGRCTGKVAIRVRTKLRKTTKTHATKLVATRRYATTRARPTPTITVNVSASVRDRVRRAAVRRVALTVTPTVPSRATFTKTIAIAR